MMSAMLRGQDWNPVIDAREATRVRQPGRVLVEVVVTVVQTSTGRRQAVRVAAANERGARALAMLHCTLLNGVPRDLDSAFLADRHLEFEVRPYSGDTVEPPGFVVPARVTPQWTITRTRDDEADPVGDDYAAYSVVIATDPHYWITASGVEPTILEARQRAEMLADAVRNVFPGLRCDLVPETVEKLDLSTGPDPDVRVRLGEWVEARMSVMLGG